MAVEHKRHASVKDLSFDRQPIKADNLYHDENGLCSRPGIVAAGSKKTVSATATIRTVRSRMAINNNGQRPVAKQRICAVEPDTRGRIKLFSLASNGILSDEGNMTLTGGTTTVMAVPCYLDSVTDMLLYTGEGDIYSAGSGMLIDESTSIYVPRVVINGRAVAGLMAPPPASQAGEPLNLLTEEFAATYTTDATSSVFYLPFGSISGGFTATLRDNDGNSRTYTIPANASVSPADTGGYSLHLDRPAGRFWYTNVQSTVCTPPLIGGIGNLTVSGVKTGATRNGLVYGCTFGSWFGEPGAVTDGGRLFVSGNADAPGTVCCSAVGNPFYFPEDGVYVLGRSTEAVTAMMRQDSTMVFFKEYSLYGLAYGDATEGVVPFVCLSDEVGCDCPDSVLTVDGHLIWATCNGEIWRLKSVDRYGNAKMSLLTEKVVDTFQTVRPLSWKTAVAVAVGGHYLVIVGNKGFWLDDPEKPTWYTWQWGAGYNVVAAISYGGQTALALRSIDGYLSGCLLAGNIDNFSTVASLISVSLDTGDILEGMDKKRLLEAQMELTSAAAVVAYTENGDLTTRMLLPSERRVPLRVAGVCRLGLKLTASSPFRLKAGRICYRLWHT